MENGVKIMLHPGYVAFSLRCIPAIKGKEVAATKVENFQYKVTKATKYFTHQVKKPERSQSSDFQTQAGRIL